MKRRSGNSSTSVVDRPRDSQSRVEYAMLSIHELAVEAIRSGHSGTIGVEIPVKDGRLGKVKRLQVVFEPE